MPQTIRLDQAGPPSVLRLQEMQQTEPGPGEVWLDQEAVGVNYLDVMQRNGAVPIPLPGGLGLEGAGRVAVIGHAVQDVAVGDRVAYALGPPGAYASGRIYPAERLVKIPDAVGFDDAAAVLFKGLTAQYLIKSTYPVGPGTAVLLYGAAGGLGRILAPWAKALGASVFGVVSKQASAARASEAGCDAVLIWGTCDLPAEVARLTEGRKADVVYDGVGRDTFEASLDCLRVRGTMVSIGASSGVPTPISVGTLGAKGSLFLTKPGLAAHVTDISEYYQRARDVLQALQDGIVRPNVWRAFPLAEAARAHEALENGAAQGTILLKP